MVVVLVVLLPQQGGCFGLWLHQDADEEEQRTVFAISSHQPPVGSFTSHQSHQSHHQPHTSHTSATHQPHTSNQQPAKSAATSKTSKPATSHQPPATSRQPPAASRQPPPAGSHQPPATSHQPPAAVLLEILVGCVTCHHKVTRRSCPCISLGGPARAWEVPGQH